MLVADGEAQRERLQILLAHAIGPPDFRILDLQLRIFLGRETHRADFVRLQDVSLIEFNVADASVQNSGDLRVRGIM